MDNNTMFRSLPPKVKMIDKVGFLKPEEDQLANHIPVWILRGGTQEIAKIEFLFRVGSYNQEKPLQAYAATNLLKTGTRNKTSRQLNALWDFYGVSLIVEAQKDIISVGFFALTRHLNTVLDIVLEIISQAIFPDEELDILLSDRRQKHIVNQKKGSHLARVHFNQLVFGADHPYGSILQLQDFDQLTRGDVENYYNRFLHPGNCYCFASGILPDNFIPLLNQKIQESNWFRKPDEEVAPIRAFPVKSKVVKEFIPLEGTLQASLRIGKLMPNRTHLDYHRISITNTLLGGYFGSRLMTNIRQDKGFTYGINSALVSLMRHAYFFITTQVGVDVKEMATEEILKELTRLRQQPASDEELLMLKNYLSASFLRSFDGPFMQMERFKEILLFGLDYDHYNDFLPQLNAITPVDVMEMAEKYFNENEMIQLMVG
ncbi:MAG: M16 family metallopeptidase [Bacteroidota bacterium]